MGDVEVVSIHELVPLLPGYITLSDIQQAICNHQPSNEPFSWSTKLEKVLVPDLLREILNVASGRLAARNRNQGGSGQANTAGMPLGGTGSNTSSTCRQGGGTVQTI